MRSPAVHPPSTSRQCPVTKDASSETWNSAAAPDIGVSISPGHSALMRTWA